MPKRASSLARTWRAWLPFSDKVLPQDKIKKVVDALVITLLDVFIFGEQGLLFKSFDVINQAFFKAAGETGQQVDQ